MPQFPHFGKIGLSLIIFRKNDHFKNNPLIYPPDMEAKIPKANQSASHVHFCPGKSHYAHKSEILVHFDRKMYM